jgi:hypothetical protein
VLPDGRPAHVGRSRCAVATTERDAIIKVADQSGHYPGLRLDRGAEAAGLPVAQAR